MLTSTFKFFIAVADASAVVNIIKRIILKDFAAASAVNIVIKGFNDLINLFQGINFPSDAKHHMCCGKECRCTLIDTILLK
mmetsp:Transcript_9798/g.16137  ORF Transcript_9798/g.16137 Transcript_9798/m.16137 type:complete len:81 (-) Transcript_9798:211-453(-)